MKRRNYWPLFFIGIFSLAFSMIVWTVHSAIKVPVNEDESFLESYHKLDADFNKIEEANVEFLSKYDFNIKINKNNLPLILNDVFLSQRALEKKSNHKNLFKHGDNNIIVTVTNKDGIKQNVKILFRISRPTNHNNTMDFSNKEFKELNNDYKLDVKLPLKGNWNITAKFIVGKDTGYLYIKSNAI